MNIVVVFINIGAYHAARLRAFNSVCKQRNWTLTAFQLTSDSLDHPWGELNDLIDFPVVTLQSDTTTLQDKKQQHRLLSQHLDSLAPDAIVIPGWGYSISRDALRWATRRNIPAVLMSESKRDDEPRIWWKEQLKSLLYVRKFSAALVGGRSHKQYLVQLGLSPEAIFLGYDVIDNHYFCQNAQSARQNPSLCRQQEPQIPARPYFIAVSRFIPRKNILRLIDAFDRYRRQLSDNHSAWDLVICGSGEEEHAIRERISQLHLQEVVYLPGFKTYIEMPKWFGLASALIHPALSEQWGLVVNEALASGLPALVSNRCGCFSELILEGANGFGFDPCNVEQLSQLMLKVSHRDTNLAAMSKSALDHIGNFSPAKFGNGLAQAVEYALSQ